MLNNTSILITGGTGSFGKKFVETVLEKYPKIKRLVIYSRDELKQYDMAKVYSPSEYNFIRYFIGDIRDGERFRRACEGIDIIVHAAALKQVPAAEYNPIEFIKTNVLGAQNVISAALDTNVKKVVALSTDKAAAPINLYGATKLCSDKLFTAANNIIGPNDLSFSVVRYGNVMGSRGSVIPYFLSKRAEGELSITSEEMTRFNITLEESVDLVMHAIQFAQGGEIFVPKIPSYRLTQLAEALAPNCKMKIIGVRPGEKIHEEMITSSDSLSTVDVGKYYIILPQANEALRNYYMDQPGTVEVPAGFSYNSENNDQWLTIEQIREMTKKHVDPTFEVLA